MAKIIKETISITISKIVPEVTDEENITSNEQQSMLVTSLPEVVQSIVDVPGIIVEIDII